MCCRSIAVKPVGNKFFGNKSELLDDIPAV